MDEILVHMGAPKLNFSFLHIEKWTRKIKSFLKFCLTESIEKRPCFSGSNSQKPVNSIVSNCQQERRCYTSSHTKGMIQGKDFHGCFK